METIGNLWLWLCFFTLIIVMLAVDIFLLHNKKAHVVSVKESLSWTIVWFTLALLFNLLLWGYLAQTTNLTIANEKALEFLTGYLLEKSLSIDNIFVFLMIFNYFSIPSEYQRKVLLYGILGAISMRLILIVFSIWLINQFHWVLYLFGLFLLITGVKLFFASKDQLNLENNPILKWMRKRLRITETLHQEKFFIRQNKWLYATPLFVVLVLVEFTDLVFALDSIPAIFAVTKDPFIVFTSNIFAILGMRALYFLFANIANRFYLLKYGLAIILVFIGCKMLIAHWIKLPILMTLSFVVITLTLSILLSWITTPKIPKNNHTN